MNKRKKKKLKKKQELFIINFANSYREVKKLDREYHQFCLECERRKKYMEQHNIKSDDTFEF